MVERWWIIYTNYHQYATIEWLTHFPKKSLISTFRHQKGGKKVEYLDHHFSTTKWQIQFPPNATYFYLFTLSEIFHLVGGNSWKLLKSHPLL
jgi:hypothetical protein